MIYLARRQSLFLAAGTIIATTNSATSQTKSKFVDTGVSGAFGLQRFAISASDDKDFLNFVAKSFFERQSAVATALENKLFENASEATSYLQSIIGTSNPDIPAFYFSEGTISAQIQAVLFVASLNAPLVPDVADIHPIGIPSIEPAETKTPDTDLEVVLDIALQTIGIFDGKTLLNEMLKDKDFLELLQTTTPAIKEKDWEKLLDLGEKLFKLMLASSFIQAYAKRVGKRFAFRLALRCVPLVGWLYAVAAFLVALKANYHRFSFA